MSAQGRQRSRPWAGSADVAGRDAGSGATYDDLAGPSLLGGAGTGQSAESGGGHNESYGNKLFGIFCAQATRIAPRAQLPFFENLKLFISNLPFERHDA